MRVPKNVTCCSILCINWGYDGVAKGAASWQCEWEVLTAADFGGMLQFRCDMRERWVGKVANAAAVDQEQRGQRGFYRPRTLSRR